MRRNILLSVVFLALVVGCKKAEEPQIVGECALAAYLRCSLTDMAMFADSLVVEQTRWRLSNMSQSEMQQLLETEPMVITEECSTEGDTCRLVLTAYDALLLGSIGQEAEVGNGRFNVVLAKDAKKAKWRVVSLEESK